MLLSTAKWNAAACSVVLVSVEQNTNISVGFSPSLSQWHDDATSSRNTIVGFKWIYVDSDTYECVIEKSPKTPKEITFTNWRRRWLRVPSFRASTCKFKFLARILFTEKVLWRTIPITSLINHFILKIMSLKLRPNAWYFLVICVSMKFNAEVRRPKQKTMFRID